MSIPETNPERLNGKLIKATARPSEVRFSHPFNKLSEMHGTTLSDATGMKRLGIHLVRVPPGKESCVFHTHSAEEEFYFVLSGRGIVEIGTEEFEIGPGDFMGFPTPSTGHHLKNPFQEDLVYMVGGERKEIEFAEFPHLKKQAIRVGREAYVVESDALQPFWKADGSDKKEE